MQSGGKEPYPELLSESEKRQLSTYGKQPRGALPGHNSKERMYFGSSDFTLSAAHRVTDLGAIQTDRAHPNRDNISHPSSPTPAANNVDKKANEDLRRKDASPQKSHLHRQTNKDPTNEEGQDNFFYFED